MVREIDPFAAKVDVTQEELAELNALATRRLNIGCGDAPMLFWTNLDGDPAQLADVHALVPPLPYADESLDDIFAGHLLEHLPRDEGAALLRECYRCLTPGGRLGIVVPDTREIMTRYLAQSIDAAEFPYRVWHRVANLDDVCALFLYSTVQASPHRWSYDRDTLARLFAQCGFERLAEIDRYGDPRIACGAWYQVGVEGFKPGPEAEPEDEWPATFDDEDDDDDE